MAERPKILALCDYYLPGHEGGGAPRTLANMVERLGDRFDFRLITRNHDGPAALEPYKTVQTGEWNDVGRAKVYFIAPDRIGPASLRRLIAEASPDAIYLNSFFSRFTVITLALKRLGRIADVPIIIAPEGEFSAGALQLKSFKKKLYIPNAKVLLLSQDIVWKAASEQERDEIRSVIGNKANIHVAPNMPPRELWAGLDLSTKPAKQKGRAKFVFLSRFMAKKNLNWLLANLGNVDGSASFDIYGTVEDAEYKWEFDEIVARLPSNVTATLRGPVEYEKVGETLYQYDFFVLPTLGENFGHVVIEALAAGLPVMISDRTPWRALAEKGIGWDLPLDAVAWQKAVQECVDMDDAHYSQMSQNARKYAAKWLADPEIEAANLAVLKRATS